MKLYYYVDPRFENFGDALNGWLWEKLIPDFFDGDPSMQVSVIGTIISINMPQDCQWIVLGSGVGYGPKPQGFGSDNWNILCVRGPLSAEILGLPQDKAITDGAFFLSFLPEYAPISKEERKGVVFMPHLTALEKGLWKKACDKAGIEYLDPTADSTKLAQRIRSARLVLADAMHAAIVADTLRVPWIPLVATPNSNTFKWLDWTLSMGVPYVPRLLPPSSRRARMANFLMSFTHKRLFINNGSAEDAVAFYKRFNSQKHSAFPLRLVNLLNKIFSACLKPYERALGFFHIDPEAKYTEAAAKALKEIASGPTYLSSEAVFAEKTAKMKECLNKLKSAKPQT
ncbi:MAG: polysaccharide pyruvyl transferase family protein [Alphaproteobacteria bacterium]|nr:polysaccharide pyruvyl transferase family protein [Alphaproteobacteria bacterium]